MDDILPKSISRKNSVNPPTGCSTICVNEADCVRTFSDISLYIVKNCALIISDLFLIYRKFWPTPKMLYVKYLIISILYRLILLMRNLRANIA